MIHERLVALTANYRSVKMTYDPRYRSAQQSAREFGKPERLSYNLSGYSSRRITDEHRLVYQLRDDELVIVQARYHY